MKITVTSLDILYQFNAILHPHHQQALIYPNGQLISCAPFPGIRRR